MPQEVISVAPGLYSVPKAEYLQFCGQRIIEMQKQIEDLEKQKKQMAPETFEYEKTVKAIARRREIIKNCEQSIFVTKAQMNAQTNARFRGL
jgi:hypothetical protein